MLLCAMFLQNSYHYVHAFCIHNASIAHLFTCSEQLNLFIMERTYYENGELILEWTDKNGNIWSAVKEQVDFLGKECFEQEPDINY